MMFSPINFLIVICGIILYSIVGRMLEGNYSSLSILAGILLMMYGVYMIVYGERSAMEKKSFRYKIPKKLGKTTTSEDEMYYRYATDPTHISRVTNFKEFLSSNKLKDLEDAMKKSNPYDKNTEPEAHKRYNKKAEKMAQNEALNVAKRYGLGKRPMYGYARKQKKKTTKTKAKPRKTNKKKVKKK